MFETTFSHASSTPIPPNLSIEGAIAFLHDFEALVKLGPDCRGCKPVSAPPKKNGYTNGNGDGDAANKMQHFEVEDDLPFIPKRLWSGGVRYLADFVPQDDGCDVTVHAPAGFTSTNHWRLIRDSTATAVNNAIPEESEAEGGRAVLDRVATKDLLHSDYSTGSGWYIQIVSDARCNRSFAGFVKGFLKNSHAQLQRAFIEQLRAPSRPKTSRRPTLGRRRSSEF